MALYDTADLVARFRRLARRPADDVALNVTDIYRYLTDAQLYWMGQFITHFPRMSWTVWERLTPAADNLSYSFAFTPLGKAEIFPTERGSMPLRAGAPWDRTADFSWQGENVIALAAPRVFADGPWAYYTPRPADIDAVTEPVLLPLEARLLLVYHALAQWAHEGGLENPEIYEDLSDSLWLGKRPGDFGLLGQLKARYASDSTGRMTPWYRSPDLSNLPISTS
jgi:hypothetical protein